jgi:hypothetical protein
MLNQIQEDVWLYCLDVAMTSSTGAPRLFGRTALESAKPSTLESIVTSGSAAMIGLAGFFASLP